MTESKYQNCSDGTPLIIPFFIMNSGCPHRCIFCNQKVTAGNLPSGISREFFDTEVETYLKWNKDKFRTVEIAFYGGSFTGSKADHQDNLLIWADEYVQKGLVHSVRVSTRPDYINSAILTRWKKLNVTTVELGAQSFVDDLLKFARRGHTANDISNAIMLMKEAGFRTGLHLMAGLPKDTRDGFIYSLDKTIELHPDTVRIHPVAVLRGTALAEEFRQGNYHPLTLNEAVDLCKLAWEKLSGAGIRIIRTGLHISAEMKDDKSIIAGPVHPALGSLVLSAIYYDRTIKLLQQIPPKSQKICFHLHKKDVARFRGLNNSNILAIKKLYPDAELNVITSPSQKRGLISAAADQRDFISAAISGIT